MDAFGAGEMFASGGSLPHYPPTANRLFNLLSCPTPAEEHLKIRNRKKYDNMEECFPPEGTGEPYEFRLLTPLSSEAYTQRYSKSDVYYSARPPPGPIKIISTHENTDGSGEMRLNLEVDLDTTSVAAWIVPILAVGPPDPCFMIEHFLGSGCQKQRFIKSTAEQVVASETVRLILTELIDDLPVSMVDSSPITVINNPSDQWGSVSPTRPPSDPGSRCSIAIQTHPDAHKTKEKNKEKYNSEDNTRQCGKADSDWMGGVRALRDSHVRLVLRQLRHVYRMNRTIDRISRASNKTNKP